MIDLDSQKRLALAGIYDSAGLQVIFDIMESICVDAENEFIGESPANREQVLAKHAVLHAQRAFFQKTAEQIDYVVSEQRGTDKKDSLALRK